MRKPHKGTTLCETKRISSFDEHLNSSMIQRSARIHSNVHFLGSGYCAKLKFREKSRYFDSKKRFMTGMADVLFQFIAWEPAVDF